MEYILHPSATDIDFDRYAEYLRTVEAMLPAHVLSFARDSRHFDLTSPSSLHDSWMESLTVRENPSTTNEARSVEVHLCLLGPQHDRLIHLRYRSVAAYDFSKPTSDEKEGGHRDLFTHEVRLDAQGLIEHELFFVSGATAVVKCRDFHHTEEILTPDDQAAG